MNTSFAHPSKLAISSLLAAAGLFSTAGSANAAWLYWTKTPVKSASVATCMSFASSAMRGAGMQNIRVSSMEVAGSRGGVYAAITCFNTAPRATAVAMAAGDNSDDTKLLSQELQHKIAGIINFD